MAVPGDPDPLAGQPGDLHKALLEREPREDDLGQESVKTKTSAPSLH